MTALPLVMDQTLLWGGKKQCVYCDRNSPPDVVSAMCPRGYDEVTYMRWQLVSCCHYYENCFPPHPYV